MNFLCKLVEKDVIFVLLILQIVHVLLLVLLKNVILFCHCNF